MVISKKSIIFQLFETVIYYCPRRKAAEFAPKSYFFVNVCLRGVVPACVRESVRGKRVEFPCLELATVICYLSCMSNSNKC